MAWLLGLPLTSGVLALHKDRDHFKMVQDRVKEGILSLNPTEYLVKWISDEVPVMLWVSVLIYNGNSKLIYYDLLIYYDRMGLSSQPGFLASVFFTEAKHFSSVSQKPGLFFFF